MSLYKDSVPYTSLLFWNSNLQNNENVPLIVIVTRREIVMASVCARALFYSPGSQASLEVYGHRSFKES